MKKLFIILLFLGFSFLSSCYSTDNLEEKKSNSITKKDSIWDISLSEKTLKKMQEHQEKEDNKKISSMWAMTKADKKNLIKNRYAILKKRLSLKSIISKWDYYFDHSQPRTALVKYLEVLDKSPNDDKILAKIGDTYFELKDFKKALNYYLKLKSKKNLNKEKFFFSLFAGVNIKNPIERENMIKIIVATDLNKEDKIYYTISLSCINNFEKCKNDFNDYFKKNKKIWNKMNNIKIAIDKYKAFQAESKSMEKTYMLDAFYKNRTFPIVVVLWEKLLEEYKDYRPIIKFLWISYYELWKYDEAKKYLLKLYNNWDEKNNVEIPYILWILNLKNGEFVASNLYFNVALKKWYENKIELKRRLIYNYAKLGQKKAMLAEFDKLLSLKNINIDDITLATYYNILAWEEIKALKYIELWIKKYPKDSIFYGYLGWIYRENWDLEKSEKYLMKWYKMNQKNPFVLLNLWYLEEQKQNYSKAIVYFSTTFALNRNWEFWELAKKERKIVVEALRLQRLEEEEAEAKKKELEEEKIKNENIEEN